MLFGKKRELRIRLIEVMKLRHALLHEPLSEAEAREFEAAKQRGLSCGVTALCDEAVNKGDAAAFSRFCPNCSYLQYVERSSLTF